MTSIATTTATTARRRGIGGWTSTGSGGRFRRTTTTRAAAKVKAAKAKATATATATATAKATATATPGALQTAVGAQELKNARVSLKSSRRERSLPMNSSSLHTSPGRLHSSHRERHPNRSVIADADGDRVQHEPVHDLRDVAPAPPAQDVVRRHEVVQPQPAIHRSVPNALAPVREPPGRVRVEVSEGRSIRAIVGLEFKGVRWS